MLDPRGLQQATPSTAESSVLGSPGKGGEPDGGHQVIGSLGEGSQGHKLQTLPSSIPESASPWTDRATSRHPQAEALDLCVPNKPFLQSLLSGALVTGVVVWVAFPRRPLRAVHPCPSPPPPEPGNHLQNEAWEKWVRTPRGGDTPAAPCKALMGSRPKSGTGARGQINN